MMLTLHIPPDIEEMLDDIAKRTGRSKSDHVLEAIIEYVGDLEDGLIASQRLDDLRAGKSETVPLEDVMKLYGVEN